MNQHITCGACHTRLEVTRVNPVELWSVNEEALFYDNAPRRQAGKKHERRRRAYDEWD